MCSHNHTHLVQWEIMQWLRWHCRTVDSVSYIHNAINYEFLLALCYLNKNYKNIISSLIPKKKTNTRKYRLPTLNYIFEYKQI